VQRVIDLTAAAMGEGSDPQRIDSIVDRAFLEERLDVAEHERSQLLVAFSQAAIDLANLRVVLRGHRLEKGPGFYEEALARGGRLSRSRLLAMAVEPFETVTDRLLESRYGKMLEPVLSRSEGRVRLTYLDKESDEYLLDQVRLFWRVSVGPERIVKYMLTRENEVAMLRVILMGKLHGLTPEAISARLPAAYLYDESGR
jgi:V/A-type H+-transporting ATPase subunit C